MSPYETSILTEILTDTQRRTLTAMSAALTDRLASMGADASGLFNYYIRRLNHKALLGECELQVLKMLRERRVHFQRIWEIGPGVGQLTAMLALDGHDVVALDRDSRRHGAMLAILEVLRGQAPAAAARVVARLGSFPDAMGADDTICGDIAVVVGCTFTADAASYRAFEEALARFGLALVDFPRLFVETVDADTWRKRAGHFVDRYGMSILASCPYQIPEEGRPGELFLIGR